MRNVTEIYSSEVYESGSGLTVIICSTKQAPQKIVQNTPYALIDINKHTLVEKQINIVRKVYPKCEILVVIGYDAHKVYNKLKTKNVRFIYNPNFDITNSLYDLGLGLYNNLNPRVLYIDGQILFNDSTIEDIVCNKSQLLLDHINNYPDFPGVTCDNSQRITFLSTDLVPKWGHVAFVTKTELELLEKYALNPRYYNNYIYEAFNKIIDLGGNFYPFIPQQYKLLNILNSQDIYTAKKVFK